MKKRFLIFVFSVAVLFLIVIAFYIGPIIKLNTLIIAANKQELTDISGKQTYISNEDYMKLRIVDEVLEEQYVQLKTKKKYKLVDIKTLNIECCVYATIKDFNDTRVVDRYEQKIIVTFVFTDNEWCVAMIETQRDG